MSFWEKQRTLARLALPILFGTMAITLLNLIDTAMVGQLGNAALAATGLGGFAALLLTVTLNGLGTGVQTLTSRRKGEGNLSDECIPLNGGLLIGLGIGIPVSALCFFLVPIVFPLLTDSQDVAREGIPYLRALLAGLAMIGCNASFRGYWNGVGKTVVYMIVLFEMVILNIFGNWVLIFGNLGAPAMGTTGAGLASLFATCSVTLTYTVIVWLKSPGRGFLTRFPDSEQLRSLLQQAIPAGIRGLGISGGYLAFFWIAGTVSTSVLAATNVLFRFFSLVLLPATALGVAGATLVGQSLGKGDGQAAKQWGWTTSCTTVVVLTLLCLPFVVIPEQLLSWFVNDPASLNASRSLQLLGLTAGIVSLEPVLRNALFGAGDSKSVMKLTLITQWSIFLPAVWIVVHFFEGGLLAIWTVMICSSLLSAILFGWKWYKGTWLSIKV